MNRAGKADELRRERCRHVGLSVLFEPASLRRYGRNALHQQSRDERGPVFFPLSLAANQNLPSLVEIRQTSFSVSRFGDSVVDESRQNVKNFFRELVR
jgi:hypothetical protein